MLRTYRLQHYMNKGKEEIVRQLVYKYRKLAQQISNKQWRYFQQNCFFNNFAKLEINNNFSTAYKQTCQSQVVGTLDSYLSNMKNMFKDIVYRSNLPQQTKIELYKLNKQNKWYTNTIAKQIFRRCLKSWRKPTYKKYNLALDNKVAKTGEDLTGLSHYPYWIKLSTLDKGHPLLIPLSTNDYYENVDGERKNFLQINLTDNNKLQFCFIKDKEKQVYTPQTEEMGLDTGLNFLFADDQGSLYGGQKFYRKLKQYDRVISKLIQRLNKNKLKTSPRYKRLVKKMRSWLKNEIYRILNHIVDKYKPREIKVEKLRFYNSNLSRRMNRLLGNFGKGHISSKLKDLEENGVVVTYINPAYTSQQCSNCGYVDKNNRKGDKFCCKSCGKKLHADVNAARNIVARSSGDEYVSGKTILYKLVYKFMVQNRRLLSQAGRQHCVYDNPYYRKSYYNHDVEIQI